MPEFVGNREHFRYWLLTGTPTMVGGGSRSFFTLFNEGGANIRLGNQSGTVAQNGFLLVSGGYIEDSHADDEWWAVNLGAGSGAVSGWITRNSV